MARCGNWVVFGAEDRTCKDGEDEEEEEEEDAGQAANGPRRVAGRPPSANAPPWPAGRGRGGTAMHSSFSQRASATTVRVGWGP